MGKIKTRFLFAAVLLLTLGAILVSQFSAQAASVCTNPASENAKAAYVRESANGATEVVAIGEDNSKNVCGSGNLVSFDIEGNLWTTDGGNLLKNGAVMATIDGSFQKMYAHNVIVTGSGEGMFAEEMVRVFDLEGNQLHEFDFGINGIGGGITGLEAVFAQQYLDTTVQTIVGVSGASDSIFIFEDDSLVDQMDLGLIQQIEPWQLSITGTYDFLTINAVSGVERYLYKVNLGFGYQTTQSVDIPMYGNIWPALGPLSVYSFHYVQESSYLLRSFSPVSMQTSSGSTIWPYADQQAYPFAQATVAGRQEAFLGFLEYTGLGMVHMTQIGNGFPAYSQFDTALVTDIAANPLFVYPDPPTPTPPPTCPEGYKWNETAQMCMLDTYLPFVTKD